MALTGKLTDIEIADLIQLNCQSAAQARLVARRGAEELELYFDGGQVVHARLGDLQGAEVVYQLLAWQDGTFTVEQGIAPPARTIAIPWSALMMEGMRRLDESRQGEGDQPIAGKEQLEMEEPKTRSQRLQETLRNLVDHSVDIQGVAVISMDGLIMAAALPQGMEQARVGAVAAGILSLSGRSVGQLGRGDLQLTLVQGSQGNVILTQAGKNAAFVALTAQEVNLGMAFLETREGAQAVANILG